MEPKLIKVDSKQNKILIIVSLLIITLFIGTSYSLLSSNDTIEDAIVFKTGDLKLELTGDSNLTLAEEYPKSDEEGKENKAIKLTFKNTGTIDICRYEVKLVSDNESTLDSKYLKYIVSENNEGDYKEAKNLDDTSVVYTGNKLKVGKSKTIYIKVWIDESAKDAGLSKTYSGSFEVDLYQGGCGAGEIGTEVVKETITAYAESSKDTFTGGLVAINTDGNLYNETDSKQIIREYRYSGPTVNNYVTFNDETWRIIGVFKDESNIEHIKIVRNNVLIANMLPETYLIDGTTYNIKFTNGDYGYWNKKTTGISNNDWATAGLQYYLNSETDANSNEGYLKKIQEPFKSMIESTKYYLGTVTNKYIDNSNNGISDTPKIAYQNERTVEGCKEGLGPTDNSSQSTVEINKTCRVWANNHSTWEGKIALLYPSDYGFSSNREYWSTPMMYGSFENEAASTSWLYVNANHGGKYEWLLSPSSNGSVNAARWGGLGDVYNRSSVDTDCGVRPTLYLKSNVKIIDGDGSQNNQYKLTLD